MNHRIFIFLVCCCAAFPGAAQNNDGNLNRRPGTTLHADSRYGDFSPARAADGDARLGDGDAPIRAFSQRHPA